MQTEQEIAAEWLKETLENAFEPLGIPVEIVNRPRGVLRIEVEIEED